MDLVRELKKTMEHESDVDTNSNWYSYTFTKGLVHGLEDLKIRGQVEIIQIPPLLRSAGILRRVLVT